MRSPRFDPAIEPRAAALDALAALLRAGYAPRAALKLWHRHAPTELAYRLRSVAKAVDLGRDTLASVGCVSDLFEEESTEVTRAFGLAVGCGGNLSGALERSADRLRAASAGRETARASAAGASLSARLVASLPLAFVPFLPLTGWLQLDLPGIVMFVVGVLLTGAGIRWIERLSPVPPESDELAGYADRLAHLSRAGLPLTTAAPRALAGSASGDLQRAAGLTRLGLTWGQALGRSSDGDLRSLGSLLSRSDQLGTPLADALESLAKERRMAATRRFDGALRRAPVRMVVPLALCVLPGFGLLALAPFLRSLTLSL